MERLGLGTKSTRHDVLQKLFDRHYVNQRQLEPTTTGIAVTEALRAHAPVITRPEMTHRLEEDMELVAQSKKPKAEVLEESREMLREAHALLTANAAGVHETLTGALDRQHFVGPCPKCGGALLLARSPRGSRWIQCVNNPASCTATYALPAAGFIEPAPEFLCATCKVPRLKITFRGQRPDLYCVNPEMSGAPQGVPHRHLPQLQEPPRDSILVPREAVRRMHRLPDLSGDLPAPPAGKAREGPAAVPGLWRAGRHRHRGRSSALDAVHQSGLPFPREGSRGEGREEGGQGGHREGEGESEEPPEEAGDGSGPDYTRRGHGAPTPSTDRENVRRLARPGTRGHRTDPSVIRRPQTGDHTSRT